MNRTAPQEIVFTATGPVAGAEHEYTATVMDAGWPRSLVGPDRLVVEHSSVSYVIDIDRERGFVAYPIRESA